MKDTNIYYPDEPEIFSSGRATFRCNFCGWITRKPYKNTVRVVIPCAQCGLPVVLENLENAYVKYQ